ncbi:MAG TPA: hypothetical protein VND93_33840, partial [Myxococcales bacterium]|nr:hypothetical protein [Myxococcales bacterium]
EAVERALESESAAVRDAAVRAGLLMRLRAAWDACVKRPSSPLALAALAMGGGEDHLGQAEALLGDDARRAEALFALGLSGRARAVDACLPWLADKKAGGLAGDVFAAVTGAAIAGRLEGKRPEEDEAEEEAPDAGVVVEPEEDLPVPEPEAVKALWEKRRPKFRPELRYLGGEPLTAARLSSALHEGPMWRRPMRALELAVRTQAAPPDLNRWARRQRAGAAAGFRHYDERPFEAFFT